MTVGWAGEGFQPVRSVPHGYQVPGSLSGNTRGLTISRFGRGIKRYGSSAGVTNWPGRITQCLFGTMGGSQTDGSPGPYYIPGVAYEAKKPDYTTTNKNTREKALTGNTLSRGAQTKRNKTEWV